MKWIVVVVLLALLALFRFRQRVVLRAWFKKGRLDLLSKRTILGFLLFELVVFIATFSPYFKQGSCKEISDYLSFGLPCLAGIVAGGGLLFDGRNKVAGSDWFYIISVLLLAGAYISFIWPAGFFWDIIFIDCILVIVASTAGLAFIAYGKNYKRRPLDGLFLPTFILFGIVSSAGGIIFYLALPSARVCTGH